MLFQIWTELPLLTIRELIHLCTTLCAAFQYYWNRFLLESEIWDLLNRNNPFSRHFEKIKGLIWNIRLHNYLNKIVNIFLYTLICFCSAGITIFLTHNLLAVQYFLSSVEWCFQFYGIHPWNPLWFSLPCHLKKCFLPRCLFQFSE